MTYRRLKLALEQIAAGASDPATIAADALRDRRPLPKPPQEPKPPKKPSGRERAVSFFEEWVRAGKPTYRKIGEMHGISGGRAGQLIQAGRRSLGHPSQKYHPLRKEAYPDA